MRFLLLLPPRRWGGVDQPDNCKLTGKLLDPGHQDLQLWAVFSGCEGSGGEPTWLVLKTRGKPARIVLDASTVNNVSIVKAAHNGLPDVQTGESSAVRGLMTTYFQFDGERYRVTGITNTPPEKVQTEFSAP